MNKADEEGVNEWDTVRDMAKVWSALPAFNAKNTLLLDNEARKFRDAPRNGIVVPEFGPHEARSRTQHTLDGMCAYLLELAAAAPPDVRVYLEQHPFGRPAPPTPKPPTPKPSPPKPTAPARAAAPLDAALAALSLGGGNAAQKTVVDAPTTPTTPKLADVPRGTALHFVCLDAGRVTLRNAAHDVSVVGDTAAPLPRLEAKMDFHRLLVDAEEAGALLEVTVKGVRLPRA
jgi:hypothetical protein